MTPLLLALALLVPAPLDGKTPEDMAVDVLCGEAGTDDALGALVAHVIDNRMALLAGKRADKVVRVLTEPHQFNGRCAITPSPPWVRPMARALVDGGVERYWTPTWMTRDVRWFTETKGERAWTAKARVIKVCKSPHKGKKPKCKTKRVKAGKRPAWTRGLIIARRYNGMTFFKRRD